MERGFHHACLDLEPQRRIIAYPGSETYPMGEGIEVMPLRQAGNALRGDVMPLACKRVGTVVCGLAFNGDAAALHAAGLMARGRYW